MCRRLMVKVWVSLKMQFLCLLSQKQSHCLILLIFFWFVYTPLSSLLPCSIRQSMQSLSTILTLWEVMKSVIMNNWLPNGLLYPTMLLPTEICLKNCIFQVLINCLTLPAAILIGSPNLYTWKKPNHPYFHHVKGFLDLSTYKQISLHITITVVFRTPCIIRLPSWKWRQRRASGEKARRFFSAT